jgi:hypothetical protein
MGWNFTVPDLVRISFSGTLKNKRTHKNYSRPIRKEIKFRTTRPKPTNISATQKSWLNQILRRVSGSEF